MVRRLHETPIAIVGMAAVMPDATNIREFWDNIVRKADCIHDVPESRWKIEDYYDPDPTAPDKTYCKRGGFLPEIDFDPMEFGLPPNILEVTDVSQMISLVVARDAMIDAGYGEAAAEIRDRTGVVLGVGGGQKLITPLTARLQYPVWREVLTNSGVSNEDTEMLIEKMKKAYIRWEENSFPGMLGNVIAGRIANRLDLGGMNCVVDAACASSMGAMKLAVSDLVEGRSDMMITGGVDTDNSIFMYMCFSKTPAFTRGDLPRPFDEQSDGMMVGEGIGMMVMKRLEDAERDGDRIYAVIRGIGTSSDGRYKSIYAPRGEGQERALDRAYEDAGVSPLDIQLIEAHGTGTAAGDMAETTTIVRFFNKHTEMREKKVALGSVKSQIGHTKAAAGIAGVLKVALALHHKVLPPTINVDNPNPKLGINDSPLYVNSETRPWITDGSPRRAGVSSFGFGGTNFHFVMEEYTKDHNNAYRLHKSPNSVVIDAASHDALSRKVQEIINNLQGEDPERQFLNLVRASRDMTIPAHNARLGFVANDAAEAVELLNAALTMLQKQPDAEEWKHPKGVFFRLNAMQLKGKVVALFSGQGSQYIDMGRELSLNFPAMRESYQKIDALFSASGLTPVSNVVYPAPVFTNEERDAQAEMLQRTDYVQPAVGAFSAGLFKTLQDAGFQPDFTAGHSFGELTALWAAGALDDDAYYALVKSRGLAMAPPDDPNFDAGTMIAVTGDVSNLKNDIAGLHGVHMANINSPKQIILAGREHDLNHARTVLTQKGYNVVPVAVSAAFHTPMVGHAQKPFAETIAQTTFNTPRIPVYSNASAQPYNSDPSAIKQTLSDHILNSVNFQQEIENLYNAGGQVFIEFGPRSVLTNLVKDILTDKPHVAIALNGSRQKDSDRQFREAVVQLRVMGLALNDIDPYDIESLPEADKPEPRRKGMNVKIHGGMYITDKTKQEYQEALHDGRKVSGGGEVREVIKEVIKEVPVIKEVVKEVPAQASAASQPAPAADMGATLEQFSQQQADVLRAHEQYLANQSEYIKVFTQLAAQQQQALASGNLNADQIASLSQSMAAFHDHQAETLRVHEDYLRSQSQYAQTIFQTMRGGSFNGNGHAMPSAPAPQPVQTTVASVAPVKPAPAPKAEPVVTPPAPKAEPVAPVAETPAPQAAPAKVGGINIEALQKAMLEIVSDKTGYPVEMLELEMDIEADLGIDSIKRVEILGAMRDQFPELPQLKPEELAELRTLGEIVDYMHNNAGGAPTPPTAPAPTSAPKSEPAPVAQSAPPTQSAPAKVGGISVAALENAMLDIVSDKTGYPVEMLELDMDIEADLGIDSIKRVEILGAMRDQFPELPQLKPEELAELRTLGEIVDYMHSNTGGGASAPVQEKPAVQMTPAPEGEPIASGSMAIPAQSAPTASAPAKVGGINIEALQKAMLEIVSDKTGYPVEMLELDMDIEADLGIDSIKRVEILGAMRDQFPELPQLKPEELAELRTLGEIVDYMHNNAGGSGAPAPAPVASTPAPAQEKPAVQMTPAPEGEPIASGSMAIPTASAPAKVGGINIEALQKAMLEIVSDKTGYPVEMLELDMDIEADLGIDSIKRVEILGAMRDQFPELPQLKPEELAELRTLGEIVDYMHNHTGGAPTPPAPTSAPKSEPAPVETPVAQSAPRSAPANGGISLEALQQAMLEIVSDKTGYPVEMLELDMDIEADLGIDSIKRVEILGAMRDQFPELPQLKPEELAELRTLGEIVDYMSDHQPNGGSNGHSNGVVATAPQTNGGAAKALPTMQHDIPRYAAQVKYLPQPDWMEAHLPDGYISLLTDDGTALTGEVAQKLTERGWKVVVLAFPQDVVPGNSPLPANVARVMLSDTTEEHLQSTLENIAAQHGAIGAFIHLNPQMKTLTGSAPNGNLFIQQEKTILKHIFLLAKHLKKSLNASADAGFGAFMTVARLDGAFSTTERNGSGAISGGLFGLTKSVNLEWVNVFCRALDLTSALSNAEAAQKVVAELFDPNRLVVEVGYTTNGRVTLVAEDFALS